MPTTTPKQAPCGSWKSPISAQMLTAKSVRLAEPQFDPADGNKYDRASFVSEYGGVREWEAAS